jgi:uncharacterized protein (TIGR02217 family)
MWPESNVLTAISGKETTIAYQNAPRYQWELSWSLLRSGLRHGTVYDEYQELIGFFNTMRGPFDSFLFTDPDDNSVTLGQIGTADGTTTAFQLIRTLGGFSEPVLAPNVVTSVLVNGVLVNPADYSVAVWGADAPGVVTFDVAPVAGAITSTFTYYWPCRFVEKNMTIRRFMNQMYEGQSVKIISKK